MILLSRPLFRPIPLLFLVVTTADVVTGEEDKEFVVVDDILYNLPYHTNNSFITSVYNSIYKCIQQIHTNLIDRKSEKKEGRIVINNIRNNKILIKLL
jgi:hypothetical protein